MGLHLEKAHRNIDKAKLAQILAPRSIRTQLDHLKSSHYPFGGRPETGCPGVDVDLLEPKPHHEETG